MIGDCDMEAICRSAANHVTNTPYYVTVTIIAANIWNIINAF